MKLERFAPEAAYGEQSLYRLENGVGSLFFYSHLLGSGIDIILNGQPRDYDFFQDILNEITIVQKFHDWIAVIKRGELEYSISYGVFSDTAVLENGLLFTDTDPIVSGPETPLPAAKYDANDGTLADAIVVSSALVSRTPAEKSQLIKCSALPK